VFHKDQDKALFIKFIEEELNMKIESGKMFPTEIDNKIKKFVGKTVITIAGKIYEIIRDRAYELNIYTYELSYDSKAFKIFMDQDYSFDKEKLLQKEILISLLNNKGERGFFEFIKSIKPINLETYKMHEYVAYLFDFHKKRIILDELENHYDETKFDKERFNAVDAIGSDIIFEDPTIAQA
jgi:hypothetical protein